MRILVTGGAGFIGSHLAEQLVADGHTVTVIDDLSTGNIANIAGLLRHARFQFVRDSVCNEMTMTALVDRSDVVFHLAAAVGVQLIIDRPVHTIETNIHGTEVTLELACRYRRKILLASTSEVYGKNSQVPFSENDDVVLGCTRFSRWSYACSKMIDEFLALAYYKEFGLESIICRFFNTVGPRQSGQYGMVVPRFVRAINVGTLESITIEDLADKIIAMTGSQSTKRYINYEEAYGQPFDDMQIRIPDMTLAERLIGFRPRYTLDDTLRQIITFERQILDHGATR